MLVFAMRVISSPRASPPARLCSSRPDGPQNWHHHREEFWNTIKRRSELEKDGLCLHRLINSICYDNIIKADQGEVEKAALDTISKLYYKLDEEHAQAGYGGTTPSIVYLNEAKLPIISTGYATLDNRPHSEEENLTISTYLNFSYALTHLLYELSTK